MEEQHGNYFIKRIQLIGRGAFGFVEYVKVYNLNKGECGDYAREGANKQVILPKLTR